MELGNREKTMNEELGLRFRYTRDIIEAVERGLLPDKIMLNTHPQRWDDRFGPWVRPGEMRSAKLNPLRSDFVYFTRQALTIVNSTGRDYPS